MVDLGKYTVRPMDPMATTYVIINLVGGFNPFEKWKSSPNRGENKKELKPRPIG